MISKRNIMLCVACLCLTATLFAQAAMPAKTGGPSQPARIGPLPGEKAPAISAQDQFGKHQNDQTLRKKNGTVLLFFRSADW